MIDKRKKYWENNYLKYWQKRVKESSVNGKKEDIKPPDEKIFKFFFNNATRIIKKEGKALDLGVGFGRFIPIFIKKFKLHVYGSDISEQMVNESKTNFPKLKKNFVIAPAEEQPFKDSFFTFINCWGVFDTTYQEKVLWEMQRLLEVGGIALITGKNVNYYLSDSKAIEAEVNARKKGHPNFFTDVKTLSKKISDFGFEVNKLYKFPKRGDFSKMGYKENVKNFYEYILILKKVESVPRKRLKYKIAEKYSNTFKKYVQG